jgi:glycerol-3-phosphate dehydrogenase
VVWRYAGVRPLYDDGSPDASSVTRDYTLRVDDAAGAAPVLSVFGGKLTTYRTLAEHVMEKLAPYHPGMKGPWTSRARLPGSDFDDRERAQSDFFRRYRGAPSEVLRGVFRRHGSLAAEVLGDGELGEHYGAGLTERELRYFMEHEWARTPDDVLWRRCKAGLAMNQAQRARVVAAMTR